MDVVLIINGMHTRAKLLRWQAIGTTEAFFPRLGGFRIKATFQVDVSSERDIKRTLSRVEAPRIAVQDLDGCIVYRERNVRILGWNVKYQEDNTLWFIIQWERRAT